MRLYHHVDQLHHHPLWCLHTHNKDIKLDLHLSHHLLFSNNNPTQAPELINLLRFVHHQIRFHFLRLEDQLLLCSRCPQKNLPGTSNLERYLLGCKRNTATIAMIMRAMRWNGRHLHPNHSFEHLILHRRVYYNKRRKPSTIRPRVMNLPLSGTKYRRHLSHQLRGSATLPISRVYGLLLKKSNKNSLTTMRNRNRHSAARHASMSTLHNRNSSHLPNQARREVHWRICLAHFH